RNQDMKMDFADAMRAATKLTRAQKLMEATRVIQSALLLGRGQTEPEDEQSVQGRPIDPPDRYRPGCRTNRDVSGGCSCADARPGETPQLRARRLDANQ